MYENVREGLKGLVYRPETKTWDRRGWDGLTKPLTDAELRRFVRQMLTKAPGPFLMHTQLAREVKAIMQELRDRKEPA